jgi:DNA repair exonuclease SbcCD ATPase subunit
MISEIQKLRRAVERKKGQKDQIEKSLAAVKKEKVELKKDLRRHEQAQEVIRQVALKTQQQLQYHISDIATMALEAVFDDPYQLLVEFVQRRNRTECDLFFVREGEKVDPLNAAGGGAVDVASFALRVASWSMQFPKSRNVLVLDEPFRYLSSDLLPKASAMLKEVSDKLNLQIIMVTHANELIETADKIFEVRKKKQISQIIE